MSTTERGTVKWFNDAKGFGFINHKSGKDVFVHYSVIQSEGFKTLKDGELVEYELSDGPKGFNAAKVYRLVQPTATESAGSDLAAKGGLANQIEVIRTESAPTISSDEAIETTVTEVDGQAGDSPSAESELSDELVSH